MRWLPGWDNPYKAEQKRSMQGLQNTGTDLERKYWVALALYAALGLLVWFTMDANKVLVHGRPVDLRLVPLIILGGLALRTVLALQADKIRRSGEKKDSY
jgi:hypothetical protein